MGEKKPLVSVIVPVYKVEDYLERCIESLRMQTMPDWETILVDDGSPDRCPQICDDAAASDPRFRVVHKENGGLSSARNAGLAIAHGDYVSFIDSDDYVDPAMLEKMVGAAQAADAQIAVCNMAKHVGETVKENCLQMFNGLVDFSRLSLVELLWTFGTGISILGCNKLYRRDIIEHCHLRFVDTQKILSEDQLFLLCYFCFVKRGVFLQEPLYHYCIRDESLSRGSIKKDILNRWTELVLEWERFMQAYAPDRADPVAYDLQLWSYFCNGCRHLETAELCKEGLANMEPDKLARLRKTFFAVAFGKVGRAIEKDQKLDKKAALYFHAMAFLLWCGKYDRPLNTYLLPQN